MRRHIYLSILAYGLLILFLLSSCSGSSVPNTPTATAHPTMHTTAQPTPTARPILSGIPGLKLPPGFQISVYATGLNIPRFIPIGPGGVLLVADRGSGSVIALPPGTSPKKSGKPIVIASNLNNPTSLVMHEGYLYVGEGSSIARMALGNDLKAGPLQRIITDLPEGGQHFTRTVLIGPDKHIYVSIGSDCNVCIETDLHRAAVWIYNMDGSNGRAICQRFAQCRRHGRKSLDARNLG